jgi:hypothetical protein
MGHKVSDGRSIVVTAPAGGVTKDDPVEVSNIFGWPDADADAAASVSLSIGQEEREVTLPAKTGGWAVGDPVFWDGTALVEAASGNRKVGRVTRAVAAAGGVGWMLVDADAWAGGSASGLGNTIIAGGTAGAHTVTGIKTTDTLVSVLFVDFTDASETGSDLTSEFSISAADEIDNTAGTDTTGGFLIVTYVN